MVSPTSLITRLSLFLLIVGMGVVVNAQNDRPNLPKPPPLPDSLRNRQLTPPPDLPDPTELYSQLEQMGDLLALPEEKLKALRQTIEFIERMSPGEREAMRIRLRQITEATPEMKTEIANMAKAFPGINQPNLTQYWYAAMEDERELVREQLQKMDKEDQATFLQAKVAAFVTKRDQVNETKKRTLEKKREELKNRPPNSP